MFTFTEEELTQLLKNAYNAGEAHRLGSFKGFTQIHPDEEEYVSIVLNNLKTEYNGIYPSTE